MPESASRKKNIVICCDGTGNQFGDSNSNVVKLYTALTIDNDQIGYYHPGVGTMGAPGEKTKIGSAWSVIKGLAFAAGFRDNVLDAYRYLMDQYDDGDHIYLLGFSRGAYTARALAGMLHAYGLLCKGNEGHIPYVWRLFTQQVGEMKRKGRKTLPIAHAFKDTFSHDVTLRFIGLWDTVSSIGWVYTPLHLLYVAQNPIVECGRHAVSIDERRCFYQDNLWGEALPHQDILQVWFAGVHSDIGGSYPQKQSALANIALDWILKEAIDAGIKVKPERVDMIFGRATNIDHGAVELYSKPNPIWPVHKSLKGSWWLLECLPHRYYDKDDANEQWRIPLGRARQLPKSSVIHPSVVARMNDPRYNYAPKNLPKAALSPHPGKQQGTAANLEGFYLYHSRRKSDPETSPRAGKVVAGVASAAALTGAVLLAKKFLRSS